MRYLPYIVFFVVLMACTDEPRPEYLDISGTETVVESYVVVEETEASVNEIQYFEPQFSYYEDVCMPECSAQSIQCDEYYLIN